MKKAILLLLLTGIFQFALAQNKKIDSLKKQLTTAKSDTIKLRILSELSELTWGRNIDPNLIFEQRLYELAVKLDSTKYQGHSLVLMGNAYGIMADYAKSMLAYYKALRIYRTTNDNQNIADVYLNMAIDYTEMNDYQTAMSYSQKADSAFRLLSPVVKAAPFAKRMGRAIDLTIGECYLFTGKPDLASGYFQKIYGDIVKTNDPETKGYLYGDFGELAEARGQVEKALFYFRNAVAFAKKNDDTPGTSMIDLSIAKLYQKSGLGDSAIIYAQKALLTAQAGGYKQETLNAAMALYRIYNANNNLADAFRYYKLATAIKDSVFSQDMTRQLVSAGYEEKQNQQEVAAVQERYENKIRTYTLAAGLLILILIVAIIWRNSNQRKKANQLLQTQKEEIATALVKLEQTKDQLIQSEKMASLGELTAGIAHEIQNPLNFVNNFSDVNTELIDELRIELEAGDMEEVRSIAIDIQENEKKINLHGKRADRIVKGMLEHSRASNGKKEPTDLNKLADEYLRLAFHGLRAKDKSLNAELVTRFDENLPLVDVVPQDIGRVLLNIFNNAFYAVQQKVLTAGPLYKPTVEVKTVHNGALVEITIKDNGTGIPDDIKNKIMQPFFTTKPTGLGTGLGLSLSYDIVVKGHNGKIDLETKKDSHSEFLISLPI